MLTILQRWGKYVFVNFSFKNSNECFLTEVLIHVYQYINLLITSLSRGFKFVSSKFIFPFTLSRWICFVKWFLKKGNTVCLLWIFVFVSYCEHDEFLLFWWYSYLCCRLCSFSAEWSQVATAAAAVAVAVISAAGNGSHRIPRKTENTQICMYVV